MALALYAKHAGQGPPVLLLHGLFGAGGNLGALARALQGEFEVFSVDLPNHGRSEWLARPDPPAMAVSLRHWMDAQGLSRVHLVGHSLGGKVAMEFALQYGDRVSALVVADIAPVAYSGQHDEVFAALEAVADAGCSSREQAAGVLVSHLREEGVIQFLLAGLRRDAQGIYRWRFDLRGLRAAYPALSAAPGDGHTSAGHTSAGRTWPGPVLFIKGGASDYIQERHRPAIQGFFPAAAIEVMPGCGHWLHVEQPEVFNRIVARFLLAHPP